MKVRASLILLFMIQTAAAQQRFPNYHSIDREVMNVNEVSPGELAKKLTASYNTNIEKTRAIFSWIAQHITYEIKPVKMPMEKDSSSVVNAGHDNPDTSKTLEPLNELVARDVLKNGSALCYGYSRLFKCLCDYAGIPCEIINGYGRGDINKIGKNFRTNHSWNAVQLDSNWYLVDVTWASGYFTYNSDEFVKHFDDQYFLTSPKQFALDHFPDDLQWSLLTQPPALEEFRHSPYKSRYFIKYDIKSFWPEEGVIEAAVGDTITFWVETNLSTDRNIPGGSVNDTLNLPPLPKAAYCRPINVDKNKLIRYSYVVPSAAVSWLQLVYNDDMILRYKLDVRDKGEVR